MLINTLNFKDREHVSLARTHVAALHDILPCRGGTGAKQNAAESGWQQL